MSASTVGDGRLTMGGHGGGGYVDVALAGAHAARRYGGGGVEGEDAAQTLPQTSGQVNALGLEVK